jgi:hypothetical protein
MGIPSLLVPRSTYCSTIQSPRNAKNAQGRRRRWVQRLGKPMHTDPHPHSSVFIGGSVREDRPEVPPQKNLCVLCASVRYLISSAHATPFRAFRAFRSCLPANGVCRVARVLRARAESGYWPAYMEQFNCSAVDQHDRNLLQMRQLRCPSSLLPAAPNGCEETLNRIPNRHPYSDTLNRLTSSTSTCLSARKRFG